MTLEIHRELRVVPGNQYKGSSDVIFLLRIFHLQSQFQGPDALSFMIWEYLGGKRWNDTCTEEKVQNTRVSSSSGIPCFLLKELCWCCSCWMADVDLLGQSSPFPSLSVHAGAVWLHRFPIKYMAADASRVMPICLLAALPADAVINHCVTGWQCPSLTSGWLRRACFLPALTKKSSELRRAACFGNAALELQKSWVSNVLNFKRPFPHSNITKYLQTIKLGIRECTSSALLFHLPLPQSSVLCMQTASPVCCMRSDTKLLGKLCGVAIFFSF